MHGKQTAFTPSVTVIISTLTIIFVITPLTRPAYAQTFTVLHNFSGGQDGAYPRADLIFDRVGNLYGTTQSGGYMGNGCAPYLGCGVVFKLKNEAAGWIVIPLYAFQGTPDGWYPIAKVVFGPNGLFTARLSRGELHRRPQWLWHGFQFTASRARLC
jgi:hypothetical protein